MKNIEKHYDELLNPERDSVCYFTKTYNERKM